MRYLILAIFLIGCGDDAPEQQNITPVAQTALREADISDARARCVDRKLPLLQLQRDSCIRDQYWCSDEHCDGIYQMQIIRLENEWENIHARANAEYNSCMGNPLTNELLGETYCISVYGQWIEWMIGGCDAAIVGYNLCPG